MKVKDLARKIIAEDAAQELLGINAQLATLTSRRALAVKALDAQIIRLQQRAAILSKQVSSTKPVGTVGQAPGAPGTAPQPNNQQPTA